MISRRGRVAASDFENAEKQRPPRVRRSRVRRAANDLTSRVGVPGERQQHAEVTIVRIHACGSLDQISHLRTLTNLTVLSGDDSLTLPMLAIGAKGVISVAGNVAPREMRELLVAWEAGRVDDAERMHRRLFPLMRALFFESNPGPVKWLLASWGLIENELRLPLVPVEPATGEKVRGAAAQCGVHAPRAAAASA